MANLNTGSASNSAVNNNNSNNMKEFAIAFEGASYSEVAPLINYVVGETLVNWENKGVAIASILIDGLYPIKEVVHLEGDDENQQDINVAKVKKHNAAQLANRTFFLETFGAKLGNITPATLCAKKGEGYDKANHVMKKMLKSLFTIKVNCNEGGAPKFHGLEFNVNNVCVQLINAPQLWFSVLAKSTSVLSVEEKALFISLMFAKTATVKGNEISRDGVTIDLVNGTVDTGNRVIKVTKVNNFGSFTEDFLVLDGLHSLFMFALQTLGGTSKQLQVAINVAVSLFAPEHNYGHKPDSDDIAAFVRANLVYSSAIKGSHEVFPGFNIIAAKQDPNFLGWVLNQGVIATSDKTNIKFVTINSGAEATGIGFNRSTNSLMTVNDAGKPTKFFNRAAANNYDCATQEERQASNFGFALSNGKVAHTKGALRKVAFTNSVLGFGSGVAIINKDNKGFKFSVAKKAKETISISLFGAQFLNNAEFKFMLINALSKKIQQQVGTIVGPSETLLEISVGETQYCLVNNNETVASVEIVSGSVRSNVMDENAIDVIIDVKINTQSSFVKTRRFGTKFTTLPYEANFNVSDEWDIILNNETVKGQGALLEMFANANGEHVLNNSTGELISADGTVINLMEVDNSFNTWKLNSVQKDVKLQIEIARSVWNNMARFCTKSVVVVREEDTFVVVEETLDVIFGELVFDVEISTPLESVSKSNFTLESAAAVYLQNRRIGEFLFNECLGKTEKFVNLANNFAGKDNNVIKVIDLSNSEDMEAFTYAFNNVETLDQRANVVALSKLYPSGISICFGKVKANINLGLLASFGQFSSANGSCIAETAAVYNLILTIISGGNVTSVLIEKAQQAYNKIINTAVSSNNVLKKATRSGSLVYGKVRTSYHPLLNSVDGIPTIVLNKNCPMVKLMGINPNDCLINYFIGFARTPMPFLGAARLKLTNDASICDVAHVLVDPYVFHALSEGDSDGDGIALFNLEALAVTKEEVFEINASAMGLAGYEHLYGDDVPFADFVSESDKVGKKSLRKASLIINTTMADNDGNQVSITPAFVGYFAHCVATHYRSAVGTSYGICSKLVFNAADVAFTQPERLETLMTATLIAWRLMYEGLSLSGYSAKAEKVMQIINFASYDLKAQRVLVIGDELDFAFNANEGQTLVSGASLLAAEFPNLVVTEEVFSTIIASRSITRVVPKLEGFGKLSPKWECVCPAAIKYGALRRISQGDDRVAIELGLLEEAELASQNVSVGKPISRIFANQSSDLKSSMFANSKLLDVVDAICGFHAQIILTQAQVRDTFQ